MGIFWKILHEKFPLNDQTVIKRIAEAEAQLYWQKTEPSNMAQFVTENLSFIVESSTAKFIVRIKKKEDYDLLQAVPEIGGIELVDKIEGFK